jgi:anti-anti-sigma regulatory factor
LFTSGYVPWWDEFPGAHIPAPIQIGSAGPTDIEARSREILSIGRLGEELKAALAANHPPAKHVLLDAESANFIDISACDALLNSIKELQSQGITFAFARMRDEVRRRLRLGGIEAIVGSSNFYERVTDGVLAWQEQERLTATAAGPQS